MRTFCTPPPSLFDTDPLEISRFGVRLANENQTFEPMENQTDYGIKRPMEIKQNGNQTTNRKSNPNSFRNAKRFRNRFGNAIKRPIKIKQIRNQTTNRKSNPNSFRNAKRFRNRFGNAIKRQIKIKQIRNQMTNRKSNPNSFRNANSFRNDFGNAIKRPIKIKKKEFKRPTGNQTKRKDETVPRNAKAMRPFRFF